MNTDETFEHNALAHVRALVAACEHTDFVSVQTDATGVILDVCKTCGSHRTDLDDWKPPTLLGAPR